MVDQTLSLALPGRECPDHPKTRLSRSPRRAQLRPHAALLRRPGRPGAPLLHSPLTRAVEEGPSRRKGSKGSAGPPGRCGEGGAPAPLRAPRTQPPRDCVEKPRPAPSPPGPGLRAGLAWAGVGVGARPQPADRGRRRQHAGSGAGKTGPPRDLQAPPTRRQRFARLGSADIGSGRG